MIEISIKGDEYVIAQLRDVGRDIDTSVRESLKKHATLLQAAIKGKLNGDVLKRKTGTLSRSIHMASPIVQDNAGSLTAPVSTNLEYARYHEYGFTGTQTVREHLRMMTMAFGQEVKNPRKITVSAHSRTVNYPAHSFMRTSLAEVGPRFLADIERIMGKQDG